MQRRKRERKIKCLENRMGREKGKEEKSKETERRKKKTNEIFKKEKRKQIER